MGARGDVLVLPPGDIECANYVRELYTELKRLRDPTLLRWHEMLDQYDGDIAIALPEIEKMERPAVANLIAIGIDQNSMAIASVRPNIIFEPFSDAKVQRDKADARRKAVTGWWDMNNWNRLTRRRARHLVAYGETVVSLSPVSDNRRDKRDIPHWKVRNPLSTFPAPNSDPDDMQRDYVVFTAVHPMKWFQQHYPHKMGTLFSGTPNPTDKYEVLEYMDDKETVLVGLGTESRVTNSMGQNSGTGQVAVTVLERVENRTGICPVVIAGRITLDRVQGQFQQYLGIERRRATLDALNTIAIFKNIFADEWAVSSSNSSSSARIVRRADGKRGIIGIVDKGQLQIVRPPLNQEIGLALDRYEAATRQAGVPAGYGGESPSNVRTGKQFDQVMGSQVDMGLQESQELLAASAEIENYIAINQQLTYYPKKPTAFFFSQDGPKGKMDYVPEEIFETDLCKVRYPLPGRDANAAAVRNGQLHGIGEKSLQTMREDDPDISDADQEAVRVREEDIDRSFMSGIEQGLAQQTIPIAYAARIYKKILDGLRPVEAGLAVDTEMKQEQADQQNNQQAAPQNAPPTAQPEQQPGLAAPPGAGAAAPPSGPPSQRLSDLLGQLNSQQNAVSQAPAPAPVGV